MKAIMLMFDSLKKNWLPPYGGDIVAPNFTRLAERTVRFDNFYVGSMPCMPARRELHTGRYGFFHKGWSPLEPFDDSMPELLSKSRVHTHLISDHHHYWRDGGANYHTRYTTYEHMRGQEGDPWLAELGAKMVNTTTASQIPPFFEKMLLQDTVNRKAMEKEEDHSQTLCYDAGLRFLTTNKDQDRWFLQLECFDPHEPFFTYEEYQRLYENEPDGRPVDWPMLGPVSQPQAEVLAIQNKYKALVSMIDRNVGRVLDFMDEHDMWKDTMLIVNADHGLLLAEHDWWSKGAMPLYNEIANIPFFIWDPRVGKQKEERYALAQNIDVAATLLEFFDVPIPEDMQGRPLRPVVENDTPIHQEVLFGYWGGAACITDGRYVYMRGPARQDNGPLYEYTLMPARMAGRMDVKELQHYGISEPFRFTKGLRPLQIDMNGHDTPFSSAYRFGSRLYDLQADPKQRQPITDEETEERLAHALCERMRATDAPGEQFIRLGLGGDVSKETLRAQREAFEAGFQPTFLKDREWTREAVCQVQTLQNMMHGFPLEERLTQYVLESKAETITAPVIEDFAARTLPPAQAGMATLMLKLCGRLD